MNRTFRLLFFLFVLSVITGYLLSNASWVGRTGINLFYRQYKFLKVWWQAGLVVFVTWLILLFLQRLAQQRLLPRQARFVHFGAVAVALLGLFFTYQDFRNNTAHRWLGERFHLGGYLFWIGWLAISLFYLAVKSKNQPPSNPNEGL